MTITLEKAMKESLLYDRAYGRMQLIINDMLAKQKADDSVDLENGEECEKSYDIMLKDLRMLANSYEIESKRLWTMVENKAEYGNRAMENLANAIVATAVEDYEMAISGIGCDEEKSMIEYFADQCDRGELVFTKLKVNDLLEQVRKGHKEFVKFAEKHGEEIIAETKRIRSQKGDLADSHYKCPMCGGGLYAQTQYGVHRVVCTHCYLSEVLKADKKKVILREQHYDPWL